MSNVILIYHSYRGVTTQIVEVLKQSVESAGGKCQALKAAEASPENVLDADVIVLASGQPFGTLSGPMKSFVEQLWNFPEKGQLTGKKYAVVVNGNRDSKETASYLDNIMLKFNMERAVEAFTCLGTEIQSALASCQQMGQKLAKA